VPPLEQILCRGRFCHAGRYRREPSFSSLHQNPLDNGHWSTATENHGRFVEACESTEVTVFRSGRIGQRVKRQKKGIWFLLIRCQSRVSSFRRKERNGDLTKSLCSDALADLGRDKS
jgi:hypothetical protein